MPTGDRDVSDATQRVFVDTDAQPVRRNPQAAANSRAAEKRAAAVRKAKKKRRERIILISLCSLAAIVLIGVVIFMVSMFSQTTDEDGTIKYNIYAAGVSLKGKTEEEAKAALHDATDGTYSQLDMTISLLGNTIVLSPEDTGARLDVDAVVKAAMEYSSSSKNQNTAYTLSIIDYLNLDTDYISSVLADLGAQYNTTLKQSSYEVIGERPSMEQEVYDTETPFQTLYIYLGTAEYGLNTDSLYQQILDAYEINLFEVNCECTVLSPEALDYNAIFQELCVEPVNADMDPLTYEITGEIYGYGFTLEALKTAIESAQYGDTIELPMYFIEPDICSDFYSKDIFQDTLASFSTVLPADSAQKTNLQIVCKLLNGSIVKAGEAFSFNELIGAPSADQGFVSAGIYLGKSYQQIMGGGISQAASTLYYCALMANLEILERTNHSYTVDYIQAGFDAQVYYGSMDLRFTNSTEYPIRIDASISGGELMIALIGTASGEVTVELTYKIDQTLQPDTVINTMLSDNAGGYQDGDVLSSGITGYIISTYALKYDIETGTLLEETLIAESYYAKRDQVVVQLYVEPEIPVETTPPETDPTETTPDETDPSDPTPSETPPTETDPSATTPSETTPAETSPEETSPATEPSGTAGQ